jgi:hypothetical protein
MLPAHSAIQNAGHDLGHGSDQPPGNRVLPEGTRMAFRQAPCEPSDSSNDRAVPDLALTQDSRTLPVLSHVTLAGAPVQRRRVPGQRPKAGRRGRAGQLEGPHIAADGRVAVTVPVRRAGICRGGNNCDYRWDLRHQEGALRP